LKVTPAIELTGFGISGTIGGLARTTYYTPDGREVRAIPNIRHWVKKDKDGKVIASGIRDANLDSGWLLQKPTLLKLFCATCDKWHDTPSEVKACKTKQDRLIARSLRSANKEEASKTVSLEQKVAALEAKIAKLMEVQPNVRAVFQQPNNEPTGETPGGNGKVKAGVQ